MKRILLIYFFSVFAMVTTLSHAQLAKDSWAFGFGGTYPRLVNHSFDYATNINYGGYLYLQRNFSEHVGLRFLARYSHLEGSYGGAAGLIGKINSFSGDLGLIYYFVPCEVISPYLHLAFSPTYYLLGNPANKTLSSDNYFAFSYVGGLGVKIILSNDLNLELEGNYHTVMDNKFDGVDGVSSGGLFGGPYKSFLSVSIGFSYLFSKGGTSNYCQIYSGVGEGNKDMTDYDRIEDMIKRHIPKEVTKEVVVEKPTMTSMEKWVLIGVNFDFNSVKLTAESYPILYDAAKTLLRNPDLKVEIQGYTDNIGSEVYNKKLAQKRADAVKNYLTSKGVSASRLRTISYGESNPVADNNTADGRALNRRIEFKIQ